MIKSTRPTGPQYKSAVWQFFGFPEEPGGTIDKSSTVCRVCETALKYTGSTTNMSTHLKRHHPDTGYEDQSPSRAAKDSKQVKCKSQQGQISLAESFKTRLAPNSPRAKLISRQIGVFIALDLRPYSVVENRGFQRLINTLEPKYEIPSRPFFSEKIVPELYNEVKQNVVSELERCPSVAITTDGWTSRATESYITITAHCVKQDWTIGNYVLQTRPLHQSHTGVNIANVLREAVIEWRLNKPGVTIACVSDNASNMDTAVRETNLSPHIRCFAHTINLAAQKALQVNEVSRLKSKQSLLQLPQHKLIQDVTTRWNSAYDMLCRFLEQQPAITAVLLSKEMRKNETDVNTLSESDVTKSEEAVELLKPLKTVTTLLCSQKHPTASMIILLKQVILKAMEGNPEIDSAFTLSIKNAVKNNLDKRYTEPATIEFLLQTSALDPRFKSLPHESENKKLEIFETLALKSATLHDAINSTVTDPGQKSPARSTIQTQSQGSPSTASSHSDTVDLSDPPNPPLKKSIMEDLFGDTFVTKIEQRKSSMALATDEISKYEVEPPIPTDDDPLQWWQKNENRFPLLATLAKTYLSIPGTSVPSERVFSTAGDVISAQRAQLKAKHVDELIFLKTNMN